MASASLRSSLRTAVAVGAFGALAVFGTAATAGAQVDPIAGPDFGSLGSLTTIFLPEAGEPIAGSLAGNLGSIADMSGSATESLGAGSIVDMRQTMVDGSSEGSLASVGQLAGTTNPDAIPGSVGGSAEGSGEGSAMIDAVDSQSIAGTLNSASLGLADALGDDTEEEETP
ncbi:hypothetical protein [Dietzia maris]|uniref:hypothetical protein n=1 Tax=Dietzia maris TaxID=37915 RepID=UPI00223A7F4C|nr:hypothetical protein [Dietzia maris]MCT1434397.1 hypothetical protein [Dietzia maris]MCT1521478.1 hypothetical protein [Dietzia maris]